MKLEIFNIEDTILDLAKQKDVLAGALIDILINYEKRGVDGYDVEESIKEILNNNKIMSILKFKGE